CSEFGLAEPRRVRQHRPEHRLQLTRRTADDLKNLGGRSLLRQRLAQIICTLPQLVEEPRVLDGDDGLRGEVLDKLDLLVGEGLDFLTEHIDRANQPTGLDHRNGQYGPITPEFDGRDDKRIANNVRLHQPGFNDLRYLL